jgi:hypothetical protein
MRVVAVASNRQQTFWLLHLLLHAVVTLMLSARPADLPVEATHLARHCLVGLGRFSGRRLPTAPGWWAVRRGEHS